MFSFFLLGFFFLLIAPFLIPILLIGAGMLALTIFVLVVICCLLNDYLWPTIIGFYILILIGAYQGDKERIKKEKLEEQLSKVKPRSENDIYYGP